mmetsp:Transcript_33676/g.61981  ORF Transcript_33676/g.61981 Transcript_33676/m.61981 type:complete len:313 (-) Transcript_33676:210-1148(-)
MEVTYSTQTVSAEARTIASKLDFCVDKDLETVTTTDVGSGSGSNTEDLGYTSSPVVTKKVTDASLSDTDAEQTTAKVDIMDQVFPASRHRQRGDVPALPRPRSPKRRARKAPPPIVVDECANIASRAPVTSLPLGPFGTIPTVSPEKLFPESQPDPSVLNVTATRCTQFGTTPLLVRTADPTHAPKSPKSPKRRLREAALTATVMAGELTTRSCQHQLQSPKKRVSEDILAIAKRQGAPLKIRVPDELPMPMTLNPLLPVKKRPPFQELVGSDAIMALRKLEPGMPVKKRVPNFVFEEPPSCIEMPPGLAHP